MCFALPASNRGGVGGRGTERSGVYRLEWALVRPGQGLIALEWPVSR